MESLLRDGAAHFNPHEANMRCQNCHLLGQKQRTQPPAVASNAMHQLPESNKNTIIWRGLKEGSANGLVSLKDEVINDRMKKHLCAVIKCFQRMRLKKKRNSIRGTTLMQHTLCKGPASLRQKAIVLVICLEIAFPALMGEEGTNNNSDYF